MKMTINCNFETKIEDCGFDGKVAKILKENNINDIGQLTDLTPKQLKKIKGLGPLGVAEILIFLKKARLRLTPDVKVVDPQLDFKKKLIYKFLKDPKNAHFGNELKAATMLLKLHPEDFWEKFVLPFKLNSLFFFLSQKGKEILYEASLKKQEIPTFQQENRELSDTKIGNDIVTHKPKSIKDFLNGR